MTHRSSAVLKKLLAVVGICAVAATGVQARDSYAVITNPLSKIVSRPLSPDEIASAGLPSTTQKSAGLLVTGVGMPAYLEVIAVSLGSGITVTQVNWTLQSQPVGSLTNLTESPLTNTTVLPIYDRGDRGRYSQAITNKTSAGYLFNRKVLTPDRPGQYVVVAQVLGTSSKSTTATNTITAANYIGVNGACFFCHGGYGVAANDNVTGWMDTFHSDAFERKIDGSAGAGFKSYCYACHVVGYDTTAAAKNWGFDDMMTWTGWTAPTSSVPGNWAAIPPDVQDKANIQCEDCHGPASEHNGDTSKIAISLSGGVCGSCHGATNHHVKSFEWIQSNHGSGSQSYRTNSIYSASKPNAFNWCTRCHASPDFIDVFDVDGKDTRTTYNEGITCVVCHDPHSTDPMNEYMLRTLADIDLGPTNAPVATITQGGMGKLCMNCHRDRFTDAVANTSSNVPDSFGPHDNPAADMLAATNGIEYGGFPNLVWRTPHLDLLEDSCVYCHMQQPMETSTDPVISNSWKYAQGHTMKMSTTGGVAVVTGCQTCHNGITNFDFVSSFTVIQGQSHDYDDDGTIEGVQTEIEGLLEELGMLLPPVGTNTVSSPSVPAATNFTPRQMRAIYNHKFVEEDRSHGVHNVGYAVSLLKASIADLESVTNTAQAITIMSSPTNGGILSPVAGVYLSSPGVYSGAFETNQYWTLYAKANAGFSWVDWNTGSTSTNLLIQMTSNTVYTMNFVSNALMTITLAANPAEGGTMSAQSTAGSYPDFPSGVTVTAYASANPNWTFTGWSSGTTTTNLSISVKSNVTYTANFLSNVTVSVVGSPAAGGSVSGGGSYTNGTQVSISAAVTNGNYVFGSWSDGGAQTHTITVPTTSATYTATFAAKPVITVAASPTAGGTVLGGGTYTNGQQVSIMATAASGYLFAGWSDGGAQTHTITVPSTNRTYTATFAKKVTVTVLASPTTGGTVTGGGSSYTNGQRVTISATPAARFRFMRWSDGGAQSHTITVPSSGGTYTAYFRRR